MTQPEQHPPGEGSPPEGAAGVDPAQHAPESLGDQRVDEAVARLDAVADRPGAEQVAEYEAVHRVLQDTLATIDEA